MVFVAYITEVRLHIVNPMFLNIFESFFLRGVSSLALALRGIMPS